ncbi:hypothetical protein SAMN04488105_105346 [Salipiger thiooxidans]|uniref:Uncharacterized protein n=1 Tax=Salipiger thiooxidans TaxID=282683 RepID=A0A1G7EGS4_9RHOB|nr:hypothetical protein SAMN04488105_105346 [Salipiger thiooxidans]
MSIIDASATAHVVTTLAVSDLLFSDDRMRPSTRRLEGRDLPFREVTTKELGCRLEG